MNYKILGMILAVVLAVVVVSGCIGSDDSSDKSPLLKLFGVPEGFEVDDTRANNESVSLVRSNDNSVQIEIVNGSYVGYKSVNAFIKADSEGVDRVNKLNETFGSVKVVSVAFFNSAELGGGIEYGYYFKKDDSVYVIYSDRSLSDDILKAIIIP